jgi:hypothetical protein
MKFSFCGAYIDVGVACNHTSKNIKKVFSKKNIKKA